MFSRAAWNPEVLGLALSHLLVRTLLPDGAALTVAVDDMLFKRYGEKVFGAAWQHDGAAKVPHPVGRGTCFVVLGLIVELLFPTRQVCVPIIARLLRPALDGPGWSSLQLQTTRKHGIDRFQALTELSEHRPLATRRADRPSTATT